jgi:hypothetical protein
MEAKKFIGTTKNGVEVYMCESTYEHMLAHPDVRMSDVKEAIMKMAYKAPFQMAQVDLGRICGKDSCVEIPAGMKPEMRTRKGRQGKTPVFLTGVKAADTSLLTIGICTDDDGKDTVFTAFYGQLAPKEPWDPRLSDSERSEAESFWASHALVVTADQLED